MQTTRWIHALAAAVAVTGLAACTDANAPSDLTDQQIEADLAGSSGDAIATDIQQAILNEGMFAGAPGFNASVSAAQDTSALTVVRTRTCYDAQDNVIACGQGAASMRVTVTIDGTVQRDNFSGIIHHTRDMTISGLGPNSTTRTHNGVGTSNDTTTFTGGRGTRHVEESSSDSIVNLVFQLPHSSNPWPVSGQIVRNVNATITLTRADGTTDTRTIARRVVVTFPADAQGNVAIQVGDLSCTLNLVTHRVSCPTT
jgi:hypothetical protein